MGKHKEKSKKHRREKKHKEKRKNKKRKSSSESSSSEDEWVEKGAPESSSEEEQSHKAETSFTNKRDDWMSLPTTFLSESNLDKRRNREEAKMQEREREQYNPREHVRELNPYWKNGGNGLPTFQKPIDDDNSESHRKSYKSYNRVKTESSWRKKPEPESSSLEKRKVIETENNYDEEQEDVKVLTDKELNILAAKVVKAEIMGNMELANELKAKLDKARQSRAAAPPPPRQEEVLLTETNSQGQSRPVKLQSDRGEYSGNLKKKKKIETHKDGERVRYFADDDKHSLHEMFQNEKFNTVQDQNNEFIKMAGKVRKNDDMDDIFADKIRRKESDAKIDSRNRDRAINEHRKVASNMDNCRLCIQSDAMAKHLMVSLGDTSCLTLPPFEPLTDGHCWISPVRHVACSTLLDENEWSDLMNFRRALTRMFQARGEDVIFFESAKNLHRYPHMKIECVPVNREEGDMAPIYFKKAIDECEAEWAQNKKLVSLKGRDVRKAVPKGLSYFFVSFGMEEGFAHVIEDEQDFPDNFAQEVIGGMLDLHHSKWKRPKQQKFDEQSKRVLQFSKEWKYYDCTVNN